MARLEIPQKLREMYKSFHDQVTEAAQNMLDPNKNAQPPMFQGMDAGPMPTPPQGVPQMLTNMAVPENIEDAYIGGILNLMPGYIAANYRAPEMIQALRRAMAAENKARGAVGTQKTAQEFRAPLGMASDLTTVQEIPDPIGQILRGSWFHGMRPEARQAVAYGIPAEEAAQFANTIPKGSPEWQWQNGVALPAANKFGLPGSTHANPTYTRFGEPYGVSITASPSVAAGGFSPDQMIHRVQPLYGGPPTEAIIPMWRPEGQKIMNEGYNTALNEWLNTRIGQSSDLMPPKWQGMTPLEALGKEPYNIAKYQERTLNPFFESITQFRAPTENFNNMYSQALQAQGKRGILYSPQRYGEYEMLMLDPSYVRPLDYRKLGEYTGHSSKNLGSDPLAQNLASLPITPGAYKGYQAAEPEFQTGATRLSDVFNQVSWVDRINEENKRRIAELIDAQYREQVINQLFGGR